MQEGELDRLASGVNFLDTNPFSLAAEFGTTGCTDLFTYLEWLAHKGES